jgi:hypothetical protein
MATILPPFGIIAAASLRRHQECLRLRIHCRVPFIQRDGHRHFVKGWCFRSRVADEYIERPEFRPDLIEDPAHLFRPANVGLYQESVRPKFADFS